VQTITGQVKSVPCAVKTLDVTKPEALTVALREVLLLDNLDHPHIVKLYGVCMETKPHEWGCVLHNLVAVLLTTQQ
jgi:serine/threonine protein kinase